MAYLLYLILGIIPSLVWLVYFLRKDAHPESKKQIFRMFVWGAVATVPALAIELFLLPLFDSLELPRFLTAVVSIFIGVALVEELAKYLAVQRTALTSPEFDEPVDAMVYMITAAMGFAAVENIVLFFQPGIFAGPLDPFILTTVRLLGATFLHALSSAVIGFFIAMAAYHARSHVLYLVAGLFAATVLHGLYNFAIIEFTGAARANTVIVVLLLLTAFVTWGFRKLKTLKSVCIIN